MQKCKMPVCLWTSGNGLRRIKIALSNKDRNKKLNYCKIFGFYFHLGLKLCSFEVVAFY